MLPAATGKNQKLLHETPPRKHQGSNSSWSRRAGVVLCALGLFQGIRLKKNGSAPSQSTDPAAERTDESREEESSEDKAEE